MKKYLIFSAGVAIAMMLNTAVLPDNPELSFWTKNISEGNGAVATGLTDNASELIVEGNTIHVLWISDSAYMYHFINYRRSIDNGITWEPIRQLARAPWNELGRDLISKRMVVHNDYVHIVYAEYYPHQVMYVRSTNGGASFEDARIIAPANYVSNLYISNDQEKLSILIFAHWIEGTFITLNSENNGDTFMMGEIGYAPIANQWESCDVLRSGNYIYALARKSEYYNGLVRGELYFYVSDNGITFNLAKLSFPSANGNDKVYGLHDFNYNPKIAVSGSHVYVIWSGLDEDDQHNVFLRHSPDHGNTWGDVVHITKGLLPQNEVPQSGQESVIVHGSCVYATVLTTNAHIYVRSSLDGGLTFNQLIPITAPAGTSLIDSGWWPQAVIDPNDPSGETAHFIWGTPQYVTTRDGGASFTKPITIGTHYSWKGGTERPRICVGEDGIIHTITEGVYYWNGVYTDKDIFYRRLLPAPDPSETAALSLAHAYGTDRYDNMTVPSSASLQLHDQVTVEVWVKAVPGSERNSRIVTKENQGSYNYSPKGYQIGTHDYGGQRCVNAGIRTTEAETVNWGPSIVDGQWAHLAMSYHNNGSENNFKLYINGQMANAITAAGELVYGEGILIIGSTREFEGFNGLIDEIRIWNYARSEQQIQQSMYFELTGNEPGLVAYYNFNNTTKDISGHGNDGYLMYMEEFVEDHIIAPDTDSDGVSDLEERGFDGMDPYFDGNNDGIPDWKQSKAASFKSFRKNRYITLASSASGKDDMPLLNVTPIEAPSGLPNGFNFPYDLVEFSLELPPGISGAEVNFYPHGSDVYDNFMNYGPLTSIINPEWYNFQYEGNTGATLANNMVNLRFVDGARGDHDLSVNNTITTLGGPAKSPEELDEISSKTPNLYIKANPANDLIVIEFDAHRHGMAELSLYSLEGKKIAVIFNGLVNKGDNLHSWDVSSLPAGAYICNLEMPEQTEVCKLIVLH